MSQFLGICPFLGVSKKVDTALGMGAAVTFVLTLATIITYLLQKYVLEAFGIVYLQTLLFILVIAALVQLVEIILKKVSPALYQALGVFLPLITTNCCILGVAILVANGTYKLPAGLEANLLTGVVFAIATAIGFALALVLFAGMRDMLISQKEWKELLSHCLPLVFWLWHSWDSQEWYRRLCETFYRNSVNRLALFFLFPIFAT